MQSAGVQGQHEATPCDLSATPGAAALAARVGVDLNAYLTAGAAFSAQLHQLQGAEGRHNNAHIVLPLLILDTSSCCNVGDISIPYCNHRVFLTTPVSS